MNYFNSLLDYHKLLKDFNSIYRDLDSIVINKVHDNDVEHSYRVAMLCWMVAESYSLKLNINKILKYSLIHDFPEVYAGDVSIYIEHKAEDKYKREQLAIVRLKKKYPNLKNIWNILDKYEKRSDVESKFVYIIEKLEPILTVILSEEDHWYKKRVTFESFILKKKSKIENIDSFAQNFAKDIYKYLEKNKKRFFPN